MRINPFKNIRLAPQLYLLVVVSLVLAGGLIWHAMAQVKATQGTLKFTIDNRMVSEASILRVESALRTAVDKVATVTDGSEEPSAAADEIESSVEAAKGGWDEYFLAKMIDEEQALADETTPLIDAAYSKIDKLVTRLKSNDLAGLQSWGKQELRPSVDVAIVNLEKLVDMQLKAANLDLEAAKKEQKQAQRESMIMLAAGGMLALALAFVIIRSALKKLGADPSEASAVAKRIANGDLLFELDSGFDDASLMAALKQMKDNLAYSKLDYEGQLKAISKAQAVIEFDPQGNILTANDNFLNTLGYTLEEVRGKHHSMFVDPRDRDSQDYRLFWEKLGRGEFDAARYKRIAKGGREVWIQASYNPILDANGKPFKVVKYATDITELRARERMNAAFKGALNQLDANVIVADNDMKIIFINPAATQMLTRGQMELRKDLPAFDASKLLGARLDSLTKDAAVLQAEVMRITEATTRQEVIGGRTLKAIMSPMKDEGGRRLGTVVEWFDRTQEVATESELQQIIGAVMSGNLDNRISLEGKRNFFEVLSRGINDLVDTIGVVVNEVQSLVASANDGDLTKRIETAGKAGLLVKIGSGINDLTENMASVVSQVKGAASEVSRGADEISQGNSNLSQRTEEQASSLEETASSMEQMTSTVKQNADNAGQASQLAVAARDQAEKGGAVVAKAVRAMTEINDASKKIADIIGVIDEIAFQTNLLALNAAVEAARAGEQGRGFAVVASEVRNLAGRSATAAKEIKTLIQDSVKKVDEGSTLVTQSGATLEQIVSAVKKVTDIVAEIAAASNEQSAGIDQVNKAVMQLDELTQQNAALVEEASAASQAMAEQARGLNDSMQRYKVAGQPSHLSQSPAVSVGSRAAAAAPVRERRKSGRPWTAAASSAKVTKDPVPAASPTGTDDAVWKEF
jgi:methyl-accepting chemotaxis protein